MTLAVAVAGGSVKTRRLVEEIVGAAPDIEILPDGGTDLADVILVAGGGDRTLLDRCRSLAAVVPCVVLLEGGATVEAVTAAMAAGARGAVAEPPDAFALLDALRSAAAFGTAIDAAAQRGMVVVVAGARGGVGTSTVALTFARAIPGPVAAIDLDVAGGTLAEIAGIGCRPDSAGLAGEASGRRAWQRLGVVTAWGRLVPAPRGLALAWLIREGVSRELVRAAAAECAFVVVDAGRAAGPAIEAVREARLIVVVARPTAAGIAEASSVASELADLAPAGARTVIACSLPSRGQRAAIEAGRLARGYELPLIVPRLPNRRGAVPGRLVDAIVKLVAVGA